MGAAFRCAAIVTPERERRYEQQQVQQLLAAEAQAALDQPLQLAEGDQRCR